MAARRMLDIIPRILDNSNRLRINVLIFIALVAREKKVDRTSKRKRLLTSVSRRCGMSMKISMYIVKTQSIGTISKEKKVLAQKAEDINLLASSKLPS